MQLLRELKSPNILIKKNPTTKNPTTKDENFNPLFILG